MVLVGPDVTPTPLLAADLPAPLALLLPVPLRPDEGATPVVSIFLICDVERRKQSSFFSSCFSSCERLWD